MTARFRFYGHYNREKDICSYCGKDLLASYSFCPFTEPKIFGCQRPTCLKQRELKKIKCEKLEKERCQLENKIKKITDKQKSLGYCRD